MDLHRLWWRTVSDDVSPTAALDESDHWVFDSGASFHITPYRDYFSTFVGKKGSAILMRNDVCCRIMKEGTIQFHMFDGVIRTLTDVCYVLGLRKSLISLISWHPWDVR